MSSQAAFSLPSESDLAHAAHEGVHARARDARARVYVRDEREIEDVEMIVGSRPDRITGFKASKLSYESRVKLSEEVKGGVLPRRGCGCVRDYTPGYRAPYCGDEGVCGCCGENEDVLRPFSDFPLVCSDCLHGTKITVSGTYLKPGLSDKFPKPKREMP